MENAGTSEEDDDIDSQDSNTRIDHGHLARNCSIKIITPAEKASVIFLDCAVCLVYFDYNSMFSFVNKAHTSDHFQCTRSETYNVTSIEVNGARNQTFAIISKTVHLRIHVHGDFIASIIVSVCDANVNTSFTVRCDLHTEVYGPASHSWDIQYMRIGYNYMRRP